MYKELIICLIVIFLIIVGNIVTQNNTIKAVQSVSQELNMLREEILKKDVKQENANNKIGEIKKLWKKEYKSMAYYIEHDELEKVETELTKLKADIETNEYAMGVENLDNCIFVLEHIKDKTALKIVNIF